MLIHLALLVAQAVAPAPDSALGEVSEVRAGRWTLRTDAGGSVTVETSEKTTVLRTQPGATTLAGAVPILRTEIAVGDRVLARGAYSPERTTLLAARIVVMKKADIQAKRETEQAEWRRRGVSGVITGLDAETKELTVRLRAAVDGPRIVVVRTAGRDIVLRRYAPHSVRFSDARPSRYEELAIGDQVRMLGNRSEDGVGFEAEQLVSGAFRTLRGTLLGVDPVRGELRIRVENGKAEAVTVTVGQEVHPRRVPPPARLLGTIPTGRAANGPTAAATNGNGGRSPQGGLDDVTERWPQVSLAELAIGEEVAVLAARSEEASRVRAIKLLAGLPAPAAQRAPGGGGAGADTDDGPDMLGSGDELP